MAERLNPYLVLDGQAREAVAFYEKVFDAKAAGIMTFGEGPSDPNHPVPEAAKNLVMHAMLKVGDTDLMFSDVYPGMPYQKGNNFNIAFITNDANKARQAFEGLATGGKVMMPLQKTFWSPAFGHVIDKYGVGWQISTEG